ncbi:MAG: hypothetical protein D6820_14540, partial [Lentisphaerae bacterium]
MMATKFFNTLFRNVLVPGAGALIGAGYCAFGHLRHLYGDSPKKREKELIFLSLENRQRLVRRATIGAVLGAGAGLFLGILFHRADQE